METFYYWISVLNNVEREHLGLKLPIRDDYMFEMSFIMLDEKYLKHLPPMYH